MRGVVRHVRGMTQLVLLRAHTGRMKRQHSSSWLSSYGGPKSVNSRDFDESGPFSGAGPGRVRETQTDP